MRKVRMKKEREGRRIFLKEGRKERERKGGRKRGQVSSCILNGEMALEISNFSTLRYRQ